MSPDPEPSPWHAGELTLQRSLGVAERMDALGRMVIRDHMPEQHRTFFPLLPFIVIGAVDTGGAVWATMRAGQPGFCQSPDARTFSIVTIRDREDPAEAGMGDGQSIGLLGIELMTRRRNRMNGRIARKGSQGFSVSVVQSFGNCPRYISHREQVFTRDPGLPSSLPPVHTDRLDDRARAMIGTADSFYVASYVDNEAGRQVDVSHRGGKPGFVRIDADGGLTIPDFNGNLFFNTLGNLLVNPTAGLLFFDDATGDLLQMSGDAEVILDSPEITAFRGAERLWRFFPRQVVHRPQGLPMRWLPVADDVAPGIAMTGSWDEAERRLAATARSGQWRPFRVAGVADESAIIRSLSLEPADGDDAMPYLAGQHLPVRLTIPGQLRPVLRTYTLSSGFGDGKYRISVKRDGVASNYLHSLQVGDTIEAQGPGGTFTIDARERRPVVFIAAGIGITPALAMLHHLVLEGKRTRHQRQAWLFQSARSLSERAFAGEVADLAASGHVTVVRLLSDPAGAEANIDYDVAGRIDAAFLQAEMPPMDCDIYLCGPSGFMQSTYDALRDMGITDDCIHAEAFGPSALRRRGVPDGPAPATVAVPVIFTVSGKAARWQPGDGTLLDLAEARGLTPEYNCRSGSCGTCRARLLAGEVAYVTPPSAQVGDDEVLVCYAVPATGTRQLQIAL